MTTIRLYELLDAVRMPAARRSPINSVADQFGDSALNSIGPAPPTGPIRLAGIADALAFLASPRAGTITGVTLRIDGSIMPAGWRRRSGGGDMDLTRAEFSLLTAMPEVRLARLLAEDALPTLYEEETPDLATRLARSSFDLVDALATVLMDQLVERDGIPAEAARKFVSSAIPFRLTPAVEPTADPARVLFFASVDTVEDDGTASGFNCDGTFDAVTRMIVEETARAHREEGARVVRILLVNASEAYARMHGRAAAAGMTLPQSLALPRLGVPRA